MALDEYRKKRDFKRTPEPMGGDASANGARFVIQKHGARRLHYDFRLEIDGVLKSWAVTRGPSLNPADKRLAVQVEDHPLDYGGFEGVIPKGEYGGGHVLLWDRGAWEPLADPVAGLDNGSLKFRLHGEKLKGAWALVRLKKDPKNWLLIKERDEEARTEGDILTELPLSVASHRPLDQIGASSLPLPAALDMELCTLVDEAPAGEEWLHEIKYDGYRVGCRIDNGVVQLLTRGGHDWTARFPAIARAAAALPCRQALLDGEIVVLDAAGTSDFSALQEALSLGREDGMMLFAFDLVHLDGADLASLGLEARKAALEQLLQGAQQQLRYSDHILGRGQEFAAKACSFALEGVISKRRDRPYRGGRVGDWLKAKCTARQEFIVVGYTAPGGAERVFGALLLGYWHDGALRYAGKVGTGFSQAVQRSLLKKFKPLIRQDTALAEPPPSPATWLEPRLVAEIEFTQWTRDGHLRHASFQGLREDKEASEVRREQTVAPVPVPAARADEAEAKLRAFPFTNPDRMLWAG